MPLFRRDSFRWFGALTAWAGFNFFSLSRGEAQVQFPGKPWRWSGGKGHWPIAISSANGLKAVEKAYEAMIKNVPALDAAVSGVNIVELDPEDFTVGYGGLPNAEGVVELDAAVMDGLSARAGSVGALHNVKTPSKVAQLIMERTDHIYLVGEGATRYAREYGFPMEDLLTPQAREKWLKWRESLSQDDDYLDDRQTLWDNRPTGTIHLSAIDIHGHVACVTTTSGLAFKIPGRVGDSPIIGAGLYCDESVGSAGSTGRGEANIKVCGAHTVVEMMRWGMHPKDACLEALKRAHRMTTEKRLLDPKGRPAYQLKFYALRKDGIFSAAVMWSGLGNEFAVCDDKGPRKETAASLFEGTFEKG